MRRHVACLLLALSALGCSESRERMPDGGAEDAPGEVRSCEHIAFAPDGTPCRFEGTCRDEMPCCTQTWTCVEGRVASETVCAPECLRSCADALERGVSGDRCEGAYYCSEFSSDLCCSHSVECAGGRLSVEDTCTPGCGEG